MWEPINITNTRKPSNRKPNNVKIEVTTKLPNFNNNVSKNMNIPGRNNNKVVKSQNVSKPVIKNNSNNHNTGKNKIK